MKRDLKIMHVPLPEIGNDEPARRAKAQELPGNHHLHHHGPVTAHQHHGFPSSGIQKDWLPKKKKSQPMSRQRGNRKRKERSRLESKKQLLS